MTKIDEPHAGHRKRIEKRFHSDNGENFEPHELLEMLLFSTIRRANTNVTAHRLIERYGSLQEVFEKGNYQDFQNVHGIGEKSAMLLAVVASLFRACERPKRNLERLKSISDYRKFFCTKLKQEVVQEVCLAVCLSDNGDIVCVEKVEAGTSGKVRINLHKLVKVVMQANCTNLIIGHNHLDGHAEPSYEDIAETRKIKEMLNSLEITLLDHVIVGNEEAYSMAEHEDF